MRPRTTSFLLSALPRFHPKSFDSFAGGDEFARLPLVNSCEPDLQTGAIFFPDLCWATLKHLASTGSCSNHTLRRPAQHRRGAPHACDRLGAGDRGIAAVHAPLLGSRRSARQSGGVDQRGEPRGYRDCEGCARTEQPGTRASRGTNHLAAAGTRRTAAVGADPTTAPASS
jgi:hypothetical protein